MDKNWLIRTKSNHILGPISKDKLLELYKNGSIKSDDEVCSGNGYWFFIREDDLVQKYLTGNEVQGFNPISEAKDVLTSKVDDITRVGGFNLADLKGVAPENVSKIQTPDAPPAHSEITDVKKKLNVSKKLKSKTKKRSLVSQQEYLKYLAIGAFLLLLLLVYFRKTLIRAIFSHVTLIEKVHAQEESEVKKKKDF